MVQGGGRDGKHLAELGTNAAFIHGIQSCDLTLWVSAALGLISQLTCTFINIVQIPVFILLHLLFLTPQGIKSAIPGTI